MGECEAAHWVAVHQCWPWWRHLVDQSTSSTAHPADYMAKRLAFGTPSCLIWLAVSNPSLWRNTLSLVSIFCSPCPTGVSAGRWSCSSFPSPYRSLLIVIGIVSDVDVVHIVLDPETMPPWQPFISGWCATALTTLLGSEGSMLKLLFLIFSFVHSSGLASPKSECLLRFSASTGWAGRGCASTRLVFIVQRGTFVSNEHSPRLFMFTCILWITRGTHSALFKACTNRLRVLLRTS